MRNIRRLVSASPRRPPATSHQARHVGRNLNFGHQSKYNYKRYAFYDFYLPFMRLIITRHGETEENKAGVIQGHLPGKLSASGIDQAKKVAPRLKDEKIDFIYSGDLKRTSDTAKEIAKFHSNTPIEFVEELRERNMGEFQGKKISDFNWGKSDFTAATFSESKEVETMEQLYRRAESFLDKIISKHQHETVLFVGSNGINKALIAVIIGKSHEDIKGFENQHNTSVNIFDIDEDKNHKMHIFNCKEHLD